MEEYDREFLTFTVKDEPVDSEEEFIGFEDNNCVTYADQYKQYVKDNFQGGWQREAPSSARETRKLANTARVNQTKGTKRQAVVRKKPVAAKIKVEILDDEVISEEVQPVQQQVVEDVVVDQAIGKTSTDIEITIMGSLHDTGTKTTCTYFCDICGAKYTRKSKLRTHILNHIVKGPNELPLCEYCGEVFDSIDKFFHHFEKTHHTNSEDVLITFDQVKHVLCCEYCGNAYAQPESLNKHRGVHAGKPKPYSCQFCDNQFDQYSKLVTHALKHNDIKTDYPVDRYWLCDFKGCTKSLKNITSLNYHKKNVHQKKYMSQVSVTTRERNFSEVSKFISFALRIV